MESVNPQEVKRFLLQYRNAVNESKAALDHLAEIRAMAERITPAYGGSGGGSHEDDKLGAAVARIIDMEDRVSDSIENLEATEREVTKVIDAVKDDIQRAILYERYINGKTFERIAVSLSYCRRQTIRLHGLALMSAGEAMIEICH